MIYGSRIPDLGLLGYDVGFQSYFRKDFFLVRAVRIRFSIQNWRHFEDPKQHRNCELQVHSPL